LKICFLIRRLGIGGAERQLLELLRGLSEPSRGHAITLITFYEGGGLAGELATMPRVNYICLHKKGRWDTLGFVFRLYSNINRLTPDVLHSYLEGSNILSALLKIIAKRKLRVVWGVRSSELFLSQYDWLRPLVGKIEARLSHRADLIIVNSGAGIEHAAKNGFPRSKMKLVYNGIDTDRFILDPGLRSGLREVWGVQPEELLIGIVARLDPIKDHPNFITAASMFSRMHPRAKFVCVGGGDSQVRAELVKQAEQLGLNSKLIWIQETKDTVSVYNALDICTLCSRGEGFSNVIAEAMSCGTPCVVTAVGDSGVIVGELGVSIPPSSPESLANGWDRLAVRLCPELSRQNRERIVEHFSRQRLIDTSDRVLAGIILPPPSN